MKLFDSKLKLEAFEMQDSRSAFAKFLLGNEPPQAESSGVQFEVDLQSTDDGTFFVFDLLNYGNYLGLFQWPTCRYFA